MSFSLAPANTPRFTLPDNELLVEGARANAFVNPRLPWDALGLRVAITRGTGATAPIGGATTDRIVETTALSDHYIEGLVTSPANQLATYSVFVRPAGRTVVWFTAFDAVSYANCILAMATLTGAGSVTAVGAGTGVAAGATIAAVGGGWYRVTVTGTASAAPNNVRLRLQLIAGATTYAGDGVMGVDVWGLQAEAGAFASSPILPAPGTIAASSRGDELVSALLSDVQVPSSGACTLLLAGRLGQAAAAGVTQMLAQIDDGTDANRVLVYCAPGTASLRMRAVLAGVAGPEVTLGTVVPGEIWRLVASLDGGGRLAASLNGAAPLAVTGGPIAGLVAALVGTSRAGEALFGTLRHVQVIPAPTQDAALPALAATMP